MSESVASPERRVIHSSYRKEYDDIDTSGFTTYVPNPSVPPGFPLGLLTHSVETTRPVLQIKRIIEDTLDSYDLSYEFNDAEFKYDVVCKSSNPKLEVRKDAFTGEETFHTLYVECLFEVNIYQHFDGKLRAIEVNRLREHSPMYTHVFQAIKHAI